MKHSTTIDGVFFRVARSAGAGAGASNGSVGHSPSSLADASPTRTQDWLTSIGDCLDEAEKEIDGSSLIGDVRCTWVEIGGREFVVAEDTHHTQVAAFKQRGAINAVAQARRRGATTVVAASTGNHGKSVGAAGRVHGIEVVVFVPSGTPKFKVDGMRAVGATVRESSSKNYDDAAREAQSFAQESGLPFIHPFDDSQVIAGQATLLTAIARSLDEEPAFVFAPVGGGGLAAGLVVAAVHRFGGRPQIVGVEPLRRPSLIAAMTARLPVEVPYAPTLAQGANVGRVGAIPFSILDGGLHSAIAVSESSIAAAMKRLHSLGIRAEGAGALPLAAVLAGGADFVSGPGPIVLLVSGASIEAADQQNPQLV